MRRRLAIPLAVLAVGWAGCGDDDKGRQAADDFRPLNGQITTLQRSIATTVQGASKKKDAQIAREFAALAQRTEALRGRVAGIDTPANATDDRNDVARALGEAAKSLRGIETAAKRSDPAIARRATFQLIRALQSLKEARPRLGSVLRESS